MEPSGLSRSARYVAFMLGLGLTIPAGAQTPPAAETSASAPAAADAAPAAPAAAAPAAAPEQEAPVAELKNDDAGPEEVVVTARRIEERAQDVPISMTIFSPQQLEDRNIVSGGDLSTYTPGLTTNTEFGSDNTSFAIRGFNQQVGTSASVAVYFADVVAPRGGSAGSNTGDGGGPGAFFDLQNAQVLKGPQGTLFGRNTDGGAILLVPQRPTSELGGYIDASPGTDNMWRLQAVLNVPLSDTLRVRFGVDHESRDGYMKNISGIGPSDFNDIGYTAARASAVWNITPNLENYSIVTYSDSDHNGSAQKLFACDPANAIFGAAACAQLDQQKGRSFWSTENDLPFARTQVEQFQAINSTTWTINDNLTAKNIVSYGQIANHEYNDLFGTAFSASYFGGSSTTPPLIFSGTEDAPGHHQNDESTTTEEIRFQGNFLDNRLTWQSGLYGEFNEPLQKAGITSASSLSCTDIFHLECSDLLGAQLSNQYGLPPGSILGGNVNYQVGDIRYHDFGIYEQASYSITDKLKFTEGLRYTMDSAEANYTEAVYVFPQPNTTPYDPNTNPYSPNSATTPQIHCQDPNSPYAHAAAPSFDACDLHLKKNSYAPTWTVGLDYKLTQDIMAYGKYSRGYRQGSVNPTSPAGAQEFNPEKVDTFELGTKTSFSNSYVHGIFNIDGFYNNFRDQQLSEAFECPASNPACGAQPNQGILNAGKSRIWGIEVESVVSPYKGVTINTSYEYINSRLVSLTPITLPAGSPYATTPNVLEGSDLPLTPKNKITSSVSYVLPLDPKLGKISAALGYTYTSGEIQSTAANTPYYKTKGYGITNLNLDWHAIAGSRFDAGFFATNLFDQRYALFIAGLYNSAGFESEIVGEPRMIGGHVRMSFSN